MSSPNDVLVVIPARYESQRFPGKPLKKILGREMILRVCDRISQTGFRFVVATDSPLIFDCVSAGGFEAVMTSSAHKSGTDRVAEACEKILGTPDFNRIVVNVQGDEPFICIDDIHALVRTFADKAVEIATLYLDYPSDGDYSGLADPNLVKIEMCESGRILTFSRNVVPCLRSVSPHLWPSSWSFKTHVGVYAYRATTLQRICRLPESPLERAERLEQLRWLEAGLPVQAVAASGRTIGIDTPEDLVRAEAYLLNTLK